MNQRNPNWERMLDLCSEPTLFLPHEYDILILEDDDRLGALLAEILEEEGFRVDRCTRSEDALKLAQNKDYDLMVSDIRMEGRDGLTTLSQIQSRQPQTDGLVITGYADDQQAKRASRLGLGGLIKKPFELDLFLNRVYEILSERTDRLQRQAESEASVQNARWQNEQLKSILSRPIQEKYDLDQLTRTIRELALPMGLSESKTVRLETAALYYALKELKTSTVDPTAEFRSWEGQLREWWDGSGPKGQRGHEILPEARILVLALAHSRRPCVEQAHQRWPGRFDPGLIHALLRIDQTSEEAEQSVSEFPEKENQDTLLSLSRTLISAGNFDSAEQVLKKVLSGRTETREGVEALRLLARLHFRAGRLEEARRLAQRLPEVAAGVGPAQGAHALQHSGRLFFEMGHNEAALDMFQTGWEQFRRMGLQTQADECYLLKRIVQGGVLNKEEDFRTIQGLLSPSHRDRLLPLLSHLVPRLLESYPYAAETAGLLVRLWVGFPRSYGDALERVSREAQSAAAEHLRSNSARLTGELRAVLSVSSAPQLRDLASLDAGGGSETPLLTVKTLGGLSVFVGETEVSSHAWKTSKVRHLFTKLVETGPRGDTEDILAEEFWPGDLEKGKRSLYVALSTMRTVLKKAGYGESPTILKDGMQIFLNPELPLEYDLSRFREICLQARAEAKVGNRTLAAPGYRKVMFLAEGAYLPGCYMDWVVRLQDQAREIALEACSYLVADSFGRGDMRETVEYAQQAVKFDPCNQSAVYYLFRALNELGRPEEVLRQYDRYEKVLEEDFDLSPQQEIVDQMLLARDLLAGSSR